MNKIKNHIIKEKGRGGPTYHQWVSLMQSTTKQSREAYSEMLLKDRSQHEGGTRSAA